ncbi:Arabinose 5-phosphate isomerase GutQ [Ewingella americana]|uniref:Arabinose 5-phosphate isomerase GutQ n=1 Tax=Ewingella americana TaxID=41202 RepID=A0A377NGN0_9GAMM|nr:Arabinose 5-phosphate isomerase GutQ [Ewingella americana]
MKKSLLGFARETLEIEIEEAQRLLTRLDDNFVDACQLLLNCTAKPWCREWANPGTSARKLPPPLPAPARPAFFVHPAEALHGDLGMIGSNDVLIFISYSGRAKELDMILPLLAENQTKLIAITGGKDSRWRRPPMLLLMLALSANLAQWGWLRPPARSIL